MNSIRFGVLAMLMAICAAPRKRSAENSPVSPGSDRDRLIGAWHLVSIVRPDGKPENGVLPAGMLIYTRDGHMSVQLMYPKSANALSNEYVRNGYEASFGSFDINEAAHT